MQERGFRREQKMSLWTDGDVSEKEVCGGAQKAVCLYGMWTRWDAGLQGSYPKQDHNKKLTNMIN